MLEIDVTKVKNKIFRKINKKYLKKENFNFEEIKKSS